MKLSDIKGERVFDVIADIIEPITSIATDKESAKLFKREKCPEGMEPVAFFLEKLKESLPSLMRNHKKELVTILSVIKGVSEEEYVKDLTFASLFVDISELLTDAEFRSFFG